MVSRKYLDPSFLLTTDLMLSTFFIEVNFFEKSIFFVKNVSPVSMEKCGEKSKDGEVPKRRASFLT